MTSLWFAIERMRGLSGVTQAWRHLAGADYERLVPFLKPRDRLATSYPRPDGCLWYRVVTHSPGEFVGLCDETGERLELTQADLIVRELDRRALCLAVAGGLGLNPEASEVPGILGTYRIGVINPGGSRHPVYLAFQPEALAVCDLALRASAPFLFLAPTYTGLSPAVEATLALRQARFLALCEALALDSRGTWSRTTAGDAALKVFSGVVGVTDRQEDRAVFRKSGQLWELTFAGRTVHLEDAKGLFYLARLLAEPERSIHVAMLLSGAEDGQTPLLGSRGDALDPQAMQAYRARIVELQEQIEEAEEFGNLAAQEAASLELDAVVGELSRATGLGGRSRQNTDADRLRKAVSNAISRSLNKISSHHPDLGRHLEGSIELGQFLTYAPAQPVAWML